MSAAATTETYRGVNVTVHVGEGLRAFATFVKGSLVERHVIEDNPIEAMSLTTEDLLARAKGLLG